MDRFTASQRVLPGRWIIISIGYLAHQNYNSTPPPFPFNSNMREGEVCLGDTRMFEIQRINGVIEDDMSLQDSDNDNSPKLTITKIQRHEGERSIKKALSQLRVGRL
jgi:hypothetical protein